MAITIWPTYYWTYFVVRLPFSQLNDGITSKITIRMRDTNVCLFLVVILIVVSTGCGRLLWKWIWKTFWFCDQCLFQDHTTFFVSGKRMENRWIYFYRLEFRAKAFTKKLTFDFLLWHIHTSIPIWFYNFCTWRREPSTIIKAY